MHTYEEWVNFKIGCLDYVAGIDLVKTPWGQFRWGEIFEIPKEYRGWADLEFPVPVCPEDQTAATLINWSFFPSKTYGLFSGETIQDKNGKTWTIQVDRYNDGTASFGWGDPEEREEKSW